MATTDRTIVSDVRCLTFSCSVEERWTDRVRINEWLEAQSVALYHTDSPKSALDKLRAGYHQGHGNLVHGREAKKWNDPSFSEVGLEASDVGLSKFEERLQKAIDETLVLLGPVGKHMFCLRLKDEFNLEATGLASDPEKLSSVLDHVLGPAAKVVGLAIARKVAAGYAIDFRENHDLTFADHIRSLRQIVSRNFTSRTSTQQSQGLA